MNSVFPIYTKYFIVPTIIVIFMMDMAILSHIVEVYNFFSYICCNQVGFI